MIFCLFLTGHCTDIETIHFGNKEKESTENSICMQYSCKFPAIANWTYAPSYTHSIHFLFLYISAVVSKSLKWQIGLKHIRSILLFPTWFKKSGMYILLFYKLQCSDLFVTILFDWFGCLCSNFNPASNCRVPHWAWNCRFLASHTLTSSFARRIYIGGNSWAQLQHRQHCGMQKKNAYNLSVSQ